MATRPLLVVCALAIRSPPLMQARPATSGLKDAPSREVYGVHRTAAWGCGSHLSNEPSVPKGSVRSSAQCTGTQGAIRCARRIGAVWLSQPVIKEVHGNDATDDGGDPHVGGGCARPVRGCAAVCGAHQPYCNHTLSQETRPRPPMDHRGSFVESYLPLRTGLTFRYGSGTVEGPAVLEVVELQGTRVCSDPCGVPGARLG